MSGHSALSAMQDNFPYHDAIMHIMHIIVILSSASSVKSHSAECAECLRCLIRCQCMSRRRTYTQTVLPGAPALQDVPSPAISEIASQRGKPVAEHKLVRTDR